MKGMSFKLRVETNFNEIKAKVENAFGMNLNCIDDEGRYVAKGGNEIFNVELVDKYDRSSELLCDDHYVLDVILKKDKYFNRLFEEDVKRKIANEHIEWERCIWFPCPLD